MFGSKLETFLPYEMASGFQSCGKLIAEKEETLGGRRDEFKTSLRKQKLDEVFTKRRLIGLPSQLHYDLNESLAIPL